MQDADGAKKFESQRAEIADLIEAGNLDVALKKLRSLHKRHTGQPQLCYLWARYYSKKDLHGRAVQWLEKALKLDEKEPDYYTLLASLYRKMNEKEKEVEALWKGADNSRDPLKFYDFLENVLVERGDKSGSYKVVAEIKKRYTGSAELYYKQGEAAFVIGLIPTAIDYFRQCVERDFVGPSQDYYLAKCFSQLGYYECARHFCLNAIRAKQHNSLSSVSELYELLRWLVKSADDKLLAALSWSRAVQAKDLGAQLQSAYLDIQDSDHQAIMEELTSGSERNRATEMAMFCRFYRNLLLNCPEQKSYSFDPKRSLFLTIGTLGELGRTKTATLYEGWLACFQGDLNKAESIFRHLAQDDSQLTEDECGNIEQGMDYIACEREEKETSEEFVLHGRLDKYGKNLSEGTKHKQESSLKGTEKCVARMSDIISQGSLKSVILIGPSGIGKTAAVRAFARTLKSKSGPGQLKGFSVWQVSTASILSGAKYIGMWEQHLEEVCNAGNFENKVILYFEDIANIFGAGRTEGGTSSFADYLIPRMENNDVVIVGELDQYQAQSVFLENSRFERVVTQIKMEEPSPTNLLEILDQEADSLAKQRGTIFSSDSLREAAALTDVFVPYAALPGKALDLVRKTSERFGVGSRGGEIRITPEDIVSEFCEYTGVPSFVADSRKPLDSTKMKKFFGDRILGQDKAIDTLMNAVINFKARLCDPKKPIKSLLFVGPTGVGKTECAKVLAEFLFSSMSRMIRLNMSEFSDGMAVSKLLGSPLSTTPGSSKFLDDVRKHPFSVVLLDEIEKADKDALNLLLQLLDEGVLTSADGKPAFFQSSVVIMTSNIGSRRFFSTSIGFGQDGQIRDAQDSVISDVKEFFSPEVYNRFDEVICFRPLDQEALSTIVNREMGNVFSRRGVVDRGISVDVDPLVRERILEAGYDPRYGARHLKRAIEKFVTLPLARLIASIKPDGEHLVRINMRNGIPSADVIEVPDEATTKFTDDQSSRVAHSKLDLADKGIKKLLSSVENRIVGLKSSFEYDQASAELHDIQKRMNNPTFWDDPKKAANVTMRYAELNRKVERIHRWETSFEQIVGTTRMSQRPHRQDLRRAQAQLAGLIKNLESAEFELLLEGKHDSADAYVIVHGEKDSIECIKWMLEISRVYTSWAQHRGYRYRYIGEYPGDRNRSAIVLLHISGLNAFGLLKNERGIHRKSITQKTGSRLKGGTVHQENKFDCRVVVLADVQPLSDSPESANLEIKKLKPSRKGWRIRSLSRRVTLKDRSSGNVLEYLAADDVESDKRLPMEMFMSYLHYLGRTRESKETASTGPWGSLVRTYETGVRSRIVDHSSKITFSRVREFLSGKIDSLLLERLM